MSPNVRSSISIVGGRGHAAGDGAVRVPLPLHRACGWRARGRAFSCRAGTARRERRWTDPASRFRSLQASRSDCGSCFPRRPSIPGSGCGWGSSGGSPRSCGSDCTATGSARRCSDRSDAFRFLEPETGSGVAELALETAAGLVTLPAEVRSQSIAGEEFLVVAAERTMVPLKTGTFDFEPASVVVDVVTRWRRDLFGGRVPERLRKRRAEDLPRRLVVREIPSLGRPPGFAGAVGQGFTLEVSADRSVVQIGDPIQLTLVLRGDGNLESAGLPTLAEDVGSVPPALSACPPETWTGMSRPEPRPSPFPSAPSASQCARSRRYATRTSIRWPRSSARRSPAPSRSRCGPLPW